MIDYMVHVAKAVAHGEGGVAWLKLPWPQACKGRPCATLLALHHAALHCTCLLLFAACTRTSTYPPAALQAAVGDLPVFSQLLGDGRTPFTGPAAIVGLDVLSQRRVVIGAGEGKRGRARQLFVSKA